MGPKPKYTQNSLGIIKTLSESSPRGLDSTSPSESVNLLAHLTVYQMC